MADKMTKIVGKVLRQAEDARERWEKNPSDASAKAEYETYMEKATTLAAAHSIDLAIARAHQAKQERTEFPEKRRYEYGDTSGRRSKRAKNSHFADLLSAIGRANDLSGFLYGSYDASWMSMVGFPSDHDMTEKMFSILAVQMVAEADAALRAGANKTTVREPKKIRVAIPEEERAWGRKNWDKDTTVNEWYWDTPDIVYRNPDLPLGTDEGQRDHPDNVREEIWDDWSYWDERGARYRKPRIPPTHKLVEVRDSGGYLVYEDKQVSTTDARVWRANFYKGFVAEVETRLRRAKRQALREAGIDLATDQTEKGIALRDKKKEIQDAVADDEEYVLATKRGGKYGGAPEPSRHDWTAREKGTEAGSKAAIGNEKDLREG